MGSYRSYGSYENKLKQLPNRLHAVIDERQRPVLRSGQLAMRIETQAAIKRGGDFARRDRPRLRPVTELVRFTDDAAAADRTAAHEDGPHARVMVAAAGRVDLRRAAELAQGRDDRILQ